MMKKHPVQITALATALLLLAACAPAAPSPTAPPPKPTEAPKAAAPAKPTEAPAPKPAEKRAAAPAKPAEAKPATKPTEAPAAKPAPKPAFDEKAVADFYRGKTIRVIVGFSPGGGYDTYSRAISRHLGRFIPGNPNVIVENMPGAGSIVAANQVYKSLPKDGTIVGNISGPIVLEQLFGTSGVEFDMAKFRYLAVPVPESYLMIVHKRAGVSKLDEMLGPSGKGVAFGAIPGSTVEHAPILVRDALGAKVKVVSGYEGTSKVRLALDSGEVDGFFNTWQSVKTTNFDDVKNGTWVVLLQLNDKPMSDLAVKVPTILDVAKTDEQRQLLLFGTSYPNQFGKVYVVAPEVPADRAAAMESAFMETFQDKEFMADAQKAKLEIAPIAGDQIRKLVTEMLRMSPDVKDKLQKVMKPTG